MKLSSVTLTTSETSEELVMDVMGYSASSRYVVRGIMGIDADEITPKFYAVGAVTGKRFYEYTMRPRDIVIRAALNPDFRNNEDVSEIRDRVYRLVSADRAGELTIQFNAGGSIVSSIKGKIVKTEVAYFSRTPELQITVNCPDPIFRSIAPIKLLPADLPSANPVKLTDQATTAPHGLTFSVKFTATTSTFVIQDHPTTPDWQFEVTPATSFAINDELHISSEYGNKRVFWDKAAGTDIDLMDKVSNDSVWPQIFPGENTLYFMQVANFDWLEVKYYSAYWGL